MDYDKIYNERRTKQARETVDDQRFASQVNEVRRRWGLDKILRDFDEMLRQAGLDIDALAKGPDYGQVLQDWEKQRQNEKEAGTVRAMEAKIHLPEEDALLIVAMIKLKREGNLHQAEIKNEADKVIWDVTYDKRYGWTIKRTISDWVDTDAGREIKIGNQGRTMKSNDLFNIKYMDEASLCSQGANIPIGFKKYAMDLDRKK